jgi:hypothetical protein
VAAVAGKILLDLTYIIYRFKKTLRTLRLTFASLRLKLKNNGNSFHQFTSGNHQNYWR